MAGDPVADRGGQRRHIRYQPRAYLGAARVRDRGGIAQVRVQPRRIEDIRGGQAHLQIGRLVFGDQKIIP